MKNSPEKKLQNVSELSKKLNSKIEMRDFTGIVSTLSTLFTTVSEYQELARIQQGENVAYSTSPILEQISIALSSKSDNERLEKQVNKIIENIEDMSKVPSSDISKILEISTLWSRYEELLKFSKTSSITGKSVLDFNSFNSFLNQHKKELFNNCEHEKTTMQYFCCIQNILEELKNKTEIRIGQKDLLKNPIYHYIDAEFEKIEKTLFKASSFNKKMIEVKKTSLNSSKQLKKQYPFSFETLTKILREHSSANNFILERELPSLILIAIIYSNKRNPLKHFQK